MPLHYGKLQFIHIYALSATDPNIMFDCNRPVFLPPGPDSDGLQSPPHLFIHNNIAVDK